MTTTEPTERVRLTVHHRHGVGACGGVLCVLRVRLGFGDMLKAQDVEYPSGAKAIPLQPLRCDTCGASPLDGLEADFREAGVFGETYPERRA